MSVGIYVNNRKEGVLRGGGNRISHIPGLIIDAEEGQGGTKVTITKQGNTAELRIGAGQSGYEAATKVVDTDLAVMWRRDPTEREVRGRRAMGAIAGGFLGFVGVWGMQQVVDVIPLCPMICEVPLLGAVLGGATPDVIEWLSREMFFPERITARLSRPRN